MAAIHEKFTIGVIGLGYVGLPLATAFGRKFKTIGFDINPERIDALLKGIDSTLEVTPQALKAAKKLTYTTRLTEMKQCNFFIVTVPTPIDQYKRPDLTAVISASESVGSVLKKGDIVVYESTVYPGLTEEICVPILEKKSRLTFNQDFFVGYSPERMNPGDKEHTFTKIVKVVAGSTPETLDIVDSIYSSVVTAGTYRADSIRVAEAAKVIENTQRDVNIALINELALLFNKLGINTQAVLNAAGTKWNFLKFSPGLVGGHCIGVDPYYLTHKAQEVGYHPDVILAGRRINDNMGTYVAGELIKLMIGKRIEVFGSNILILGFTFKENCPDIRNTRVVDIYHALTGYHTHVSVYDPWADPEEIEAEYQIKPTKSLDEHPYDAIVLAVAHKQFRAWKKTDLSRLTKKNCAIYDVKHAWEPSWVDGQL